MDFNFNDYKGNYAMHCKTQEEDLEFRKLLDEIGRSWCSGDSYLYHDTWDTHKENTCHDFNHGKYCELSWFLENDFKVIEWSDFSDESKLKNYSSMLESMRRKKKHGF